MKFVGRASRVRFGCENYFHQLSELAKENNIVATPSVFRTLPAPVRKSVGDLAEKHKVLLALDLFSLPKPKVR
jgi:circadian clock protein KaiB